MSNMEQKGKSKICFGTLALGENYRSLAKLLSKDIEKYSPNTPLIVLTDKPQDFANDANVLAFKHRQQSVGCYHDKRFVIEKGLSLFDSCIFIDADMRILAPIEEKLEWQPGITAHTVWTNILKHNKNQFEIKLLSRMAEKLNLNLEEISFVHECLFVVTKDSGKEQEFLRQWDRIAPFFELNGFYRGEGNTIGLAAAQAEFNIRRDPIEKIVFFKDKIEHNRIKKGEVNQKDKIDYFKIQRNLEYPQYNILQKIIRKISKILGYFSRIFSLRIKTLNNVNFYYN
ncbi:MAG: hypothetical protein QNJ33_11240 [Crocosphaera sp.]|nr:hypothetical protein [Crocosphaera sp.]